MIYGMKTNTYLMLLHLSQLLAFVVPVLGLIAPIVLWAIQKDNEPSVDRHGKIILNWIISAIIYVVIGLVLTMFFIGVIILAALVLVSILFPIIGGIKANDGIEWTYPLSVQFFKISNNP
jgi:uncharacterized Tic20 family protein